MALDLWARDDYGHVADRSCWAMFAITTVVVSLRIYTRIFMSRTGRNAFGVDDAITIFCMLVFLTTCILITIGTQHGLGRRMATLDPAEIPPALKMNVVISSVLIWTFSMPKFAIITILKRILDYGTKTTVLFWGLALSSQACILATSVWWYKQCDPVEFGWDQTIPGGSCAPVSVMADLGYFTSAYSAFLDIFFALYPIPFIMRLNMPLKKRIAISVAMGLSFLACVVSIYKLAIFGSVFEELAQDPTHPVPYLDILGVAEGMVLLVCASLPTLGPLIRLVAGKIGASIDSSKDERSRGLDDSANTSGVRRNWENLKGHETDDPERGSAINASSVDDIPLVQKGQADGGIQKTTEFTLVTEHHRR